MQSQSSNPIHRTILPNGIILLVTENPTVDIVAASIFVQGGSCRETQEQSGLVNLLATLITKGCEGISSMDIAEAIESVGATFGVEGTRDYILFSFQTVATDFCPILELAAKIIRFPTFPELELERERKLALQDIRLQREQPFSLAFDNLRQIMYGNHPEARSGLENENSLANLNRDDLLQFHQTYFRPDNLVISIAGSITTKNAIQLVESIFGDWQIPSDRTLPPLDFSEPHNYIHSHPSRQIYTPQDTQQSIIMVGYLAASIHSPDYFPLKLLATHLGDGSSSRLFVELREKRGLAYEVSALYPPRMYAANFVAYTLTAPENTKIALQVLQTEVDRLSSEKLSPPSLQCAKNKILGQCALGKQTNAQLAEIYGWSETLGLGINFDTDFQNSIANLTSEELLNAAYQYLREPYISLVGQQEAINGIFGE